MPGLSRRGLAFAVLLSLSSGAQAFCPTVLPILRARADVGSANANDVRSRRGFLSSSVPLSSSGSSDSAGDEGFPISGRDRRDILRAILGGALFLAYPERAAAKGTAEEPEITDTVYMDIFIQV